MDTLKYHILDSEDKSTCQYIFPMACGKGKPILTLWGWRSFLSMCVAGSWGRSLLELMLYASPVHGVAHGEPGTWGLHGNQWAWCSSRPGAVVSASCVPGLGSSRQTVSTSCGFHALHETAKGTALAALLRP